MDNDALAAAAMLSQLGEEISTEGLENLSEWNWESMEVTSCFVTEDGLTRKKSMLTVSRVSGNDGEFEEAGTKWKYTTNGKNFVFAIEACRSVKAKDDHGRTFWQTCISGELHLAKKP